MNVLIIPEDFDKDQYVLKPIIAAIMRRLGKPRAHVTVCHDPRLRGIAEALDRGTVQTILKRYRYEVDLFLLLVDRDGVATRRAALDNIEAQAAPLLSGGRKLVAENAWQEIEVWVLAGHDLPPGWHWQEIRREIHPKERYFDPFAGRKGVQGALGNGRRPLAQEAARRHDRIRQLCPEDVLALEARIQRWMEENG